LAQIISEPIFNIARLVEAAARVAQTTRRHKAVTIQPEQNGPRNWMMVLPIFPHRLQCLDTRGTRLSPSS
jgi:hypothetical protein